ncbi:MAG TPA: DnaJ domain-containing protein [Planctomycetota bacterium]|nr:DnaJ domain-containing protein [Planctomycetota bacterium]
MMMRMAAGDAYDVLGVPPSADDDEIKRAFRLLAHRYHPDKSPLADDHERFKAARRAYEELCDPEARARLDLARGFGRPAGRAEPLADRDIADDIHDGVDTLVDLLAEAFNSIGPGGSAHLRERYSGTEQRFEGRVTGPGRVLLDAVLSPREAREGIVIPFRFQLGPRLISRNLRVPPGVKRGDRFEYVIQAAADVDLTLVVHVDIA